MNIIVFEARIRERLGDLDAAIELAVPTFLIVFIVTVVTSCLVLEMTTDQTTPAIAYLAMKERE